jgi:DNA-binding XRE family transcriptional regulator
MKGFSLTATRMNIMEHQVTTYGKALKAERIRKELTQRQLADATGTTQQNIGGIEKGKSVPRPELHLAFLDLFGPHSPLNNASPRGAIIQIATRDAISNMRRATDNTGAVPAAKAPTEYSEMADELARMFDNIPTAAHMRAKLFSQITNMLTRTVRQPQ